jgi:electron transfer flavoprotein alpha subunit
MSNKVWVYIDLFHSEPLITSWEVLGAGLSLADSLGGGVTAVVFGKDVAEVSRQAFGYGANQVFLADDPALDDYRPEPYTSLLARLAKEHQPEVFLFPTTTRGRELAAMCAVDLDTGVLPDVTELEVKDGLVQATRPIYGGKLLSKVVCHSKPQIITCRVRAFPRPAFDPQAGGEPVNVQPELTSESQKTRVVEYIGTSGGVSLSDAGVIVSGGRGLSNNPNLEPPAEITDEKEREIWKAQQGFKLLGELAEVLGGAVGASRAAVDAGYIPYQHQVGQTGKVVSPDLYVAVGISGAIQHLAGMRTSKIIVAINKDPDAPIFKLARFGVVGDAYEIVPALVEAFRKKLGK